MKYLLSIIVGALFVLPTNNIKAQSVIEVKYQTDANLSVAQVQDSASADLVVYKVASADLAGSNNGTWYFAGFPDGTMKKIFFTQDPSVADFKVYYTNNQSGAGWLNLAKKSLMD